MDLRKQPPRSPRVRLGGFPILPRMLDKGRASLAGMNGEYKFACPLDRRFLDFVEVDPEQLKQQLAQGKGDREILEWITANARRPRSEVEIAAWAELQERRVPSDVESREFFHGVHAKIAPSRTDIATWFDLLDLDDYVSFGGKP